MTVLNFDVRYALVWPGTVIARSDPKGIGRIKAKIPGLTDSTGWALPFAQPFAGKAGLGSIEPPPINATVAVGFLAANVDMPYYLTGNHPVGGAPTGFQVTSSGDNKVWADEAFVIEKDSRGGNSGYRITDKATGGTTLKLEIDLETMQIEISGTVGVRISSVGAVRINGGSVSINNRVVRPVGQPI